MYLDFQYDPISGPISGPSFVSQTEEAINELGEIAVTGSEEAKRLAQEALHNSETAQATAGDALTTAQDAKKDAYNAVQISNSANSTAQTAQSTTQAARSRANEAYDLAVASDSKADAAATTANNANNTAKTAISTASSASSTAQSANTTAQAAFDAANNANGYYTVVDESVNADTRIESAEKSLITNTASTGFPIGLNFPLYFSVVLEDSEKYSTQFCWSQNDSGSIYMRTGSLTEDEAGNASASWGAWNNLADMDPATKTKLGAVIVGDGLSVAGTGRLSVDFSQMPTDKFEELLKSLRLPQWLTANRTWYVRSDGNDNNDGSTASKAFRSVDKALTTISENFNLSRYNATVNIGAGVFSCFYLLPYQTTIGTITITGAGVDSTIIRDSDAFGNISCKLNAGKYYIRNLSLDCTFTKESSTSRNNIAITAGSVTINNINFTMTEKISSTTAFRTMIYANGGEINVREGCTLTCNGASTSRLCAIFCTNNGTINIFNDVTISGTGHFCLRADPYGTVLRNGTLLPLILGTFIGQRYWVREFSRVSTANGGANYFPGTKDGSVSALGVYS